VERNQDAIDAARATLQNVKRAVDEIAVKATYLESLLVVLAHTAASDDLPPAHRENVCILGAEMAAEIRATTTVLA
jgi:hypothetical protein